MRGLTTALTWALFTLSSLAAADALQPRQGTASLNQVTCGSNKYSRVDVDAAVAEGCRLHAAGKQIGRQNYPHTFKNFEGLPFAAAGPYQEFPILSSGAVYTGNSPGPDRVVFNPNLNGQCLYVGTITHTNAPTTNGFVLCVESYLAGGSSTASATPSSTSTAAAGATSAAGEDGAVRLAGEGLMAVVGAVAGLLVL
ncbi:hypothetical protein VTJ49DRAFT_1564 [Mycothermus thermophilus]|uniref:ribonuclease T1 n=1 Tax=Humicola insolens TaxID=85995 RepID=A0ABR3VPH5_HUMIN